MITNTMSIKFLLLITITFGADTRQFGFINEHNDLVPYPEDVNQRIRNHEIFEYTSNVNENWTYKINSIVMKQENLMTHVQRDIKEIHDTLFGYVDEHGTLQGYPEWVSKKIMSGLNFTYTPEGHPWTYEIKPVLMEQQNTVTSVTKKIKIFTLTPVDNGDGDCAICMTNPKSEFFPCGHYCLCVPCAFKITDKCPMCNKPGKAKRLYKN